MALPHSLYSAIRVLNLAMVALRTVLKKCPERFEQIQRSYATTATTITIATMTTATTDNGNSNANNNATNKKN